MEWGAVGAVIAAFSVHVFIMWSIIKFSTSNLNKRIDDLREDVKELRSDAKDRDDVVPIGVIIKDFEGIESIEKIKKGKSK